MLNLLIFVRFQLSSLRLATNALLLDVMIGASAAKSAQDMIICDRGWPVMFCLSTTEHRNGRCEKPTAVSAVEDY